MPLQLHWFLPSHGDGRELAKTTDGAPGRAPRREPDVDYLAQVAEAADRFGFESVLTPFGLFCEDPWLVATVAAARTRRLKFMIAYRPGFMSPLLAAQMAATFQRLSGGRLLFNIVTGSDADEQHRYGDWLDHDQRYARTAEFLDAFTRIWPGQPADLEGEHYRMHRALLARPYPVRPPIFVGGSSSAAGEVAARFADVHLTWGEGPQELAETIKAARARAGALGREVGFGTRFHVITRPSAEEAWSVADGLLAAMDPARIRQAQERFAASESEGQRRAMQLHGGRTDRLEIYPNVWAGFGLVRPGVTTALVGSYEQVAERIEEFHAVGVDHLILSAQPHLEEAYSLGEGVLPLLRARGVL